jgi:hypothetical protein
MSRLLGMAVAATYIFPTADICARDEREDLFENIGVPLCPLQHKSVAVIPIRSYRSTVWMLSVTHTKVLKSTALGISWRHSTLAFSAKGIHNVHHFFHAHTARTMPLYVSRLIGSRIMAASGPVRSMWACCFGPLTLRHGGQSSVWAGPSHGRMVVHKLAGNFEYKILRLPLSTAFTKLHKTHGRVFSKYYKIHGCVCTEDVSYR